MEKYRLFVDMDGTLAEFKKTDVLEQLYEKGYFRNLAPLAAIVEAVRNLAGRPEIEVFILSAVLSDSRYALEEKNRWLDEYVPEIDTAHRIFLPCGTKKKLFVPGGAGDRDFLLDDYSKNLREWGDLRTAIKVYNGINGTNGTWRGSSISIYQPPHMIEERITGYLRGKEAERAGRERPIRKAAERGGR